MKTTFAAFVLIVSVSAASAEDKSPASTLDNVTKSARDMLPSMPSLPSVSLPSMPDFAIPDFSDASGRVMTEFNSFTNQVGDALPLLEQMGYEVSAFRVTWGLPPRARLRLKSVGASSPQKIEEIAAKASEGKGILVSALLSSAAAAKRIQGSMKLATAYLDVDFAVPPKVSMRFANTKSKDKDDTMRDLEDLELACR